MTLASFAFILTGVLLNAGAQLLLKAGNAIAAYYLLGEAVTPMRLAGIGVIIVGVFIVARS